jgi:hypothetical protein
MDATGYWIANAAMVEQWPPSVAIDGRMSDDTPGFHDVIDDRIADLDASSS